MNPADFPIPLLRRASRHFQLVPADAPDGADAPAGQLAAPLPRRPRRGRRPPTQAQLVAQFGDQSHAQLVEQATRLTMQATRLLRRERKHSQGQRRKLRKISVLQARIVSLHAQAAKSSYVKTGRVKAENRKFFKLTRPGAYRLAIKRSMSYAGSGVLSAILDVPVSRYRGNAIA